MTDVREPRARAAALGALALFVVALFAPMLVRGEVVFTHDNRLEVGLAPDPADTRRSIRFFNDQVAYYIPEIEQHLSGDRAGWLETWNPRVQLGRPMSHVSGFSPVFLPTRILGWCTQDPFRLYTWLALLTVAGAALFSFLFLESLRLHPWACCAGAAAIAFAPFTLFWLTFVMFAAGLCWTAAILWLVVRMLERPTLWRGIGLAFSVHALLLTAYPQQIVWHAWFVVPFAIAQWWREPARRFQRARALVLCTIAGVLAAAPVYVDLAVQASRSARASTDPAFFEASLPDVAGFRDHLRWLATLFDMHFFADPLTLPGGGGTSGVSWTPLVCAAMALALATRAWRRALPWIVFAAVTLVFALWPDLYRFGVARLGLSLSRFLPAAASVLPIAVAAAIGIDAALRGDVARRRLAVLAPCAAAVGMLAIGYASNRTPLALQVALILGVAAGLSALVVTRRAFLVPVLVAISVLAWSAPLVLSRPRSSIATDSPLVERVRELTSDGSRFAIVSPARLGVLPPNEEALLGLTSIHSYDSLSSLAYQAWSTKVLALPDRALGRKMTAISDPRGIERAAMSFAGLSAVVSASPIVSPALVPAGEFGAFHVSACRQPPLRVAHVLDPIVDESNSGIADVDGALWQRRLSPVSIVEERDDRLVVEVQPVDQRSLLFVSSQYHPDWEARGGPTACVNGLWLGVVLPPGAAHVELEFRPWARWMQLVQGAFVALAVLATWRSVRRRQP